MKTKLAVTVSWCIPADDGWLTASASSWKYLTKWRSVTLCEQNNSKRCG